ncbi:MAG: sugar ABC transporter ATP-binding protein [Oscillospiraceae bacterium]
MAETALSVRHITKTYPGVIAINDISIDFLSGEVHALVGENGAGKSTLIKTIAGAIQPDSGEIEVFGAVQSKTSPSRMRSLGIEVIYQEFNLVPALSVAENIFLGAFLGNGKIVDKKEMERQTAELFKTMQININPKSKVEELSVGYMQMVEIAKAISRDVKILIMDEPTAPLTTHEVDILYQIIDLLKKKGVTIIYISHRLNEIYKVSDRLTILRDGNKVATKNTSETSRDELIKLMVARETSEAYPTRTHTPGEVVLEVQQLSGKGAKDISFTLRKGEVLGFGGLIGAGRTEMARMLFGADPATSGKIILDGKEVKIKSPQQAVKLGIGLVPEDRKQQGVILPLSIKENIVLPIIKDISHLMVVDKKRENTIINSQKDALRIKTPTLEQLVMNLSGGNQQKVALSKWLVSDCKILIFDEPTRGIDIGAKQEIYNLINQLSAQGMAVIIISSEMEEMLGMSDRIVVLCEGQMMATLDKSEFSQEKILALASGYQE